MRRPSRASRFDSLEQEVFLGIWRTYDRLRLLEEQVFAPFDLTPQQYNVLRLLSAERPGALPTLALAERLVSRAPDITRICDRLEQRGLIARERAPEDRRVVRVRIQAAGLALLRDLAGPVARCHALQLGHLPAAKLRRLAALLGEARGPHEPEASSWR